MIVMLKSRTTFLYLKGSSITDVAWTKTFLTNDWTDGSSSGSGEDRCKIDPSNGVESGDKNPSHICIVSVSRLQKSKSTFRDICQIKIEIFQMNISNLIKICFKICLSFIDSLISKTAICDWDKKIYKFVLTVLEKSHPMKCRKLTANLNLFAGSWKTWRNGLTSSRLTVRSGSSDSSSDDR